MTTPEERRTLIRFRAGRVFSSEKQLYYDERQGWFYLYESSTAKLRHCWKDVSSGKIENDMELLPGKAEFKPVPHCERERVYALKIKGTPKRHLFWIQEPEDGCDEIRCKMVNDILNYEHVGHDHAAQLAESQSETRSTDLNLFESFLNAMLSVARQSEQSSKGQTSSKKLKHEKRKGEDSEDSSESSSDDDETRKHPKAPHPNVDKQKKGNETSSAKPGHFKTNTADSLLYLLSPVESLGDINPKKIWLNHSRRKHKNEANTSEDSEQNNKILIKSSQQKKCDCMNSKTEDLMSYVEYEKAIKNDIKKSPQVNERQLLKSPESQRQQFTTPQNRSTGPERVTPIEYAPKAKSKPKGVKPSKSANAIQRKKAAKKPAKQPSSEVKDATVNEPVEKVKRRMEKKERDREKAKRDKKKTEHKVETSTPPKPSSSPPKGKERATSLPTKAYVDHEHGAMRRLSEELQSLITGMMEAKSIAATLTGGEKKKKERKTKGPFVVQRNVKPARTANNNKALMPLLSDSGQSKEKQPNLSGHCVILLPGLKTDRDKADKELPAETVSTNKKDRSATEKAKPPAPEAKDDQNITIVTELLRFLEEFRRILTGYPYAASNRQSSAEKTDKTIQTDNDPEETDAPSQADKTNKEKCEDRKEEDPERKPPRGDDEKKDDSKKDSGNDRPDNSSDKQ